MTVNQTTRKGQQIDLEDGSRITLWTEQEDRHAVTVVAKDDDGAVLGQVRVERDPPRSSGSVAFWTAPGAHRRGIARAGLLEALRWAASEGFPFLGGEVAVDDHATRAFLARCGLAVAWRTDGATARFAILVPGRLAKVERSPNAAGAFDRAAIALESGASIAEADSVFERLGAATRRHPSHRAA
jgi:GNAT superfamily N-acetyltransferase